MPDSFIDWVLFMFFAIGSAGGFAFLVQLAVDKFHAPRRNYNPWEEMSKVVSNHYVEHPISGRKK